MKILWLTNILIPEIAEKEGLPISSMGGWIQGIYRSFCKHSDGDELVFVFPHERELHGELFKTVYYSFIESEDIKRMSSFFLKIIDKESPSIIHIFGTEYPHSFALMHACEKTGMLDKSVISIQGLVSIYARHMYNNLPEKVLKRVSFNELKHRNSINSIVKDFVARGSFERKAIEMCKNISGRTDWDRQCSYIINENARYFHVGEILRDVFYSNAKWDVANCERHSVFISQCSISLKGAHNAIEAVSYLVDQYPDIKLYIAGETNVFGDKKYKTNYEKYIEEIIKKYGLLNNICFLGTMNEEEMHTMYLKANVFVCPSSIENSPNSVCEAMISGTPVVAAHVGGMVNLIKHGETGFLFQADAPYMIAYYTKQIFDSTELAQVLSKNAVNVAEKRHSRTEIVMELKNMYNDILKRNSCNDA